MLSGNSLLSAAIWRVPLSKFMLKRVLLRDQSLFFFNSTPQKVDGEFSKCRPYPCTQVVREDTRDSHKRRIHTHPIPYIHTTCANWEESQCFWRSFVIFCKQLLLWLYACVAYLSILTYTYIHTYIYINIKYMCVQYLVLGYISFTDMDVCTFLAQIFT